MTQAAQTKPPEALASEGPFADRMDDWPNDDLLLTEKARARLEADFPGALAVYDWPELRSAFESVDPKAGRSRKLRQRNGVIAVSLAGIGAAIIAVLPLFEFLGVDVERWAFAAAAACSLVGFIATVWVTSVDRHAEGWLHNRWRTERMRQLYFQFMSHDPGLAARALAQEPNALAEWRVRRDNAFKLVSTELEGPARMPTVMLMEDVNHRHVWITPRAQMAQTAPARGRHVDDCFEIMRRQRIQVQLFYVRRRLQPGFASPETAYAFIQISSYMTALAALFLSLIASVLLFKGASLEDASIAILTSLMALVCVVSIYLKLLGDGLQVRADLDRYRWYREALTDLEARYHDPDPATRLQVLREVEQASYRELREFFKTHHDARFSFG